MLFEAADTRALTDLLTVASSAGSTVGGAFGAMIGWTTWRRALEYLALGAAAGTVVTYRILVSALGDPFVPLRALRKRSKEERRLPRPIH